jgi:hypothetical protein
VTVVVREADVRVEQKDLIDLLSRHFDDWAARGSAKFEWLYLSNPFGRARAWVLESGPDRFLGVSTAFPRTLRAGGRTFDAWVLGDFCVDAKHRSLGPALQLQRAVSTMVDRGEVGAWYDFPSRTMQAIYRRMGVPSAGQMVRFVHPLRVDGMIRGKVENPLLAEGLKAFGNAVLGARDALRGRDASVEIQIFEDDFSKESVLGQGLEGGVSLDRTPEYLQWRYRREPQGANEILAAWRKGVCGGLLVFRAGSENHAILDAFGIRQELFLRELVLEVLARARESSATSVTASISSDHPWTATFSALGFHRREAAPYFVYSRSGAVPEGAPWFLMGGDRD